MKSQNKLQSSTRVRAIIKTISPFNKPWKHWELFPIHEKSVRGYINLWLIITADNISVKEIFLIDIICFHIREEVSIYPHLGVQGQLSNAAEQVMVRSPDCGVAAISSPGSKPLYNHSAPNRSQFSVCCTTRCCLHTHRAPVWVFNYMMNCCPRVALQSVSLCCSVDVEMLQLSKNVRFHHWTQDHFMHAGTYSRLGMFGVTWFPCAFRKNSYHWLRIWLLQNHPIRRKSLVKLRWPKFRS